MVVLEKSSLLLDMTEEPSSSIVNHLGPILSNRYLLTLPKIFNRVDMQLLENSHVHVECRFHRF